MSTLTFIINKEIIMQINSLRIKNAIENTKVLSLSGVIPPEYFENTLASRQPNGTGSVFHKPVSEKDLIYATWEPYVHSAIQAGCTAFKTLDVSGVLGVVLLGDLNPSSVVSLEDPKETGQVSAVIPAKEVFSASDVGFTIMILGKEGGKEIVFTFHPGDPIQPSKVDSGITGVNVPVVSAMALGLEYAKVSR